MEHPLLAAACVAALASAGVYIVWGPDNLFRRKVRCPGLLNLGNTCFLNAVLQALAPLEALRSWTVFAKRNGPLSKALDEVLIVLAGNNDTNIYSPEIVLRALARHRWRLTFEQQDAHELYHLLISTVEDETFCLQTVFGELNVVSGGSDSKSVLTKTGRVILQPRRPHVPLRGRLCDILQCCVCKKKLPVRYEHFHSLSLSLPNYQNKCSLKKCLQHFVQSELVYGVECPNCSKHAGTVVKTAFVKKLQLGLLPECLCIHINRITWQPDSGLNKNCAHVSFPLKLDMGHYLVADYERINSAWYSLVSVIEHSGGPTSGHYMTYRKVYTERKEDQWVYVSDTSIYCTDLKQVLGANAFMLFYQRISQ